MMWRAAIPPQPRHATCWRSSRVEHLICNQAVVGSIPIASFEDALGEVSYRNNGEVPEWPKGADCKSAGVSLRRFESSPLHSLMDDANTTEDRYGVAGRRGNSSVG